MADFPFFDAHTHNNNAANNTAIFNLDMADIATATPAFLNEIAGKIINHKTAYFSVGLHPWHLSKIVDMPVDMSAAFRAVLLAAKLDNVVAIGETGLDKYHEKDTPKALQSRVLVQHIDLAKAVNKPLILHTVGRFNETLQLLKQHSSTTKNTNLKTMLHGFRENPEVAQMFWQIGVYTSFGAAIFSSTKAADSLRACPLALLLLETDAQTTYNIIDIYAKAAELRGCTLVELAAQVQQNFEQFFGLSFI